MQRYFLSLIILFAIVAGLVPQAGYAQIAVKSGGQAAAASLSSALSASLTAIEEKVEKRRAELGIPGLSLVIVKDDQVIYMKGLGYKDFEKKIAVTPDTQFAIGSATKAFTALSVLMTADEGKVNLDDSPKKYLPYFKMFDPDTDKNMTVRDLMAHTSGLNRTDLAMITGRLNREELIRVAGEAKPMAKLREKWFYQNIMFAAAGEVVAKTQKMPWEKFVPERIFAPLGMANTNMSIKQMEKAKDISFGYEYNFDTKETRRLPFRPIDEVAPAGSINSSARDMANWLRFVLNGGVVNGKRLVSERGFEEWTKPQMNITPNGKMSYGLGWFLQEWNGLKVVQHGGNIDGFNALVAMIPEKKLGFVMLTNVSGSPLGGELMPLVWENILGKPESKEVVSAAGAGAGSPEKEVGKYRFEAAGFDIEVKMENGKLMAVVPGQPVYELQKVGGRKYKLAGAPDGFFVTFKDDSAYLEQPQGNYTLPKQGATQKTAGSDGAKELVGKYLTPNGKGSIEVTAGADGKVTLNIEGQSPYALVEKSKDSYLLNPLPDNYSLKAKRGDDGKIVSIIIDQPEGQFEFKRMEARADDKPKMSVDEIMSKALEAAGGEANWRKITSRVTVSDIDAAHQGVKGSATTYERAPNKSAVETTMTAVGKVIAKGLELFDGTNGEEAYTFAPLEKLAGKKLEDARLGADFYGMLNWKTNYKTAELKGMDKVGDEDCYKIEFTPEKGTKVTEYYSAKSFLLLKITGVVASSTSEMTLPYTVTLSDYRDVDGIKLPFKTVNNSPSMGDIVNIVRSVKHNVAIDDKVFTSRPLKLK
jgi:CubicO group peptidase (beta-lactamase class C family)